MSNAPPMMFPPARNPNDLGCGPLIMGLSWSFTGLAIIATILRMIVCRKRRSGLLIDDWLMFVATIFLAASQILLTLGFHNGMGKHDVDLWLPYQLEAIIMYGWLIISPTTIASIVARISIAILLVRLFGVHLWFKIMVITVTIAQVVLSIALIVSVWAQTTPVEGLWQVFRTDITRWDSRVVLYQIYFTQSLCTFSDIAFVVIPVAIIWRMNLELSRRIGLIVLMAVSLFTAAASIAKTIFAISEVPIGYDTQYKSSLSLLWIMLESACVILLGCVPPLRPLLTTVQQRWLRIRSLGTGSATASIHTWRKGDSSRVTYESATRRGSRPKWGWHGGDRYCPEGGKAARIMGETVSPSIAYEGRYSVNSSTEGGHSKREEDDVAVEYHQALALAAAGISPAYYRS